jgi:hypothetical protein
MLKDKIQKIKDHFVRNQAAYISGGTGILVGAGITLIIMRGRHAGIRGVPDTAENSVFVRPLSFLSTQTNNIVTVVERENRGHPGYLIRCLETNEIFTSQKQAARAKNVSDAIFSLHVRRKLDDINGLHFERMREFA